MEKWTTLTLQNLWLFIIQWYWCHITYVWKVEESPFFLGHPVYQINQNFALIKDLRSKIPTNAHFDHQGAVKMPKFETLLPSNANIMTMSLYLLPSSAQLPNQSRQLGWLVLLSQYPPPGTGTGRQAGRTSTL